MKSKRIIAIGGGEIKNYGTLEIDRYIAEEAKKLRAIVVLAVYLFLRQATTVCLIIIRFIKYIRAFTA